MLPLQSRIIKSAIYNKVFISGLYWIKIHLCLSNGQIKYQENILTFSTQTHVLEYMQIKQAYACSHLTKVYSKPKSSAIQLKVTSSAPANANVLLYSPPKSQLHSDQC